MNTEELLLFIFHSLYALQPAKLNCYQFCLIHGGINMQGQVRDSRGRLPLSLPRGLLHLLPSTTDRWWLPYNHTLPIRPKQFVVNQYFHEALCKQHSCASFGYPCEVAKATRTVVLVVVKCEEPHGRTELAQPNWFR